jgi:hypothetical protein
MSFQATVGPGGLAVSLIHPIPDFLVVVAVRICYPKEVSVRSYYNQKSFIAPLPLGNPKRNSCINKLFDKQS